MNTKLRMLVCVILIFNLGVVLLIAFQLDPSSNSDSNLYISQEKPEPPANSPKKIHWKDSKEYEVYLFNSRFDVDNGQQIEKDPNYCENHKLYRELHPLKKDEFSLPLSSEQLIFSDYKSKNIVKTVIRERSSLVLEDHDILTEKEDTPKEPLPLNITMFIHKSPDWHYYYEIGKEWLCPGQRYNHIPGHENLVLKDLLIEGLQEYSKHFKDRPKCFDPWLYVPFTYNLARKEDCLAFKDTIEKETNWTSVKWIMKKSRNSHNSEGIFLLDKDQSEYFKKFLNDTCGVKVRDRDKYIAQKYIQNPLLINGKKFDFRMYILVASMDPLIVLYHDGFLRVSSSSYDPSSSDAASHITNTQIIKNLLDERNATDEEYETAMKEQMWTLEEFEEYMIRNQLVDEGWVDSYLKPAMKKKIAYLFRFLTHRMLKHPGLFELFGIDFLVDSDHELWILEITPSPAMQGTSKAKEDLLRGLINGMIDIEYALMLEADLDEIINQSGFEMVIDGRKRGEQRYQGFITKECF